MPDVQMMLTLLEEHGAYISPFVRTVIDMARSGEAAAESDAITLLRMCARLNRQPADLGSTEAPSTSDAWMAA